MADYNSLSSICRKENMSLSIVHLVMRKRFGKCYSAHAPGHYSHSCVLHQQRHATSMRRVDTRILYRGELRHYTRIRKHPEGPIALGSRVGIPQYRPGTKSSKNWGFCLKNMIQVKMFIFSGIWWKQIDLNFHNFLFQFYMNKLMINISIIHWW